MEIISLLSAKGISFAKGLSSVEIGTVREMFGVVFPEDLKRFYQTAVPVSRGFVNWRYAINSVEEAKSVKSRLDSPRMGLLFDVKYNALWLEESGEQPESYEAQVEVVNKAFHPYPRLIPIYGHRYMPESPSGHDNPVLSVYQSDIIYYGNNLWDYFANEFSIALPESVYVPQAPREIPFWSHFV